MRITPSGHQIDLLSEHAVFLPSSSALVLADVHLGKAATFQAHGLPVPQGDDLADLKRIDHLLEKTQARQLIIAGDFLHSPIGISAELTTLLQGWLKSCPADLTLVKGNHDQRALKNFPMQSVVKLNLDGLDIIHDPADATETFSICGHLHPVIKIKDGRRRPLQTPCFWLKEHTLILPSFGSFTGGQPIKPCVKDKIFAPLREGVVEIPPSFL